MSHLRFSFGVFLCCCLLLVLSGCSASNDKEAKQGKGVLRLATTTSTVGSGLFDVLIPAFESKYRFKVEVLAKGTGAALQLARQGEADVVLVHSRAAEDRFVVDGYGVNRRDVMYNEFVIVGPVQDPAGILGETDVLAVLKQVAESKALFISRGDQSGTHDREMDLWNLAGITPHKSWYRQSGKGMLDTLRMASKQKTYVLTDMSTFLFNRKDLELVILVNGDERLFNPYGVIAVNPMQVEGVNFSGAMTFSDFITSKEGQSLIRDYGKERFGKPLFIPLLFDS